MRILGIDIGGTSIKLGLFNERTDLLASWMYETKGDSGGRAILDNLTNWMKEVGKIDAIGVCVPGQIDTQNGDIIGDLVNIPDSKHLPIKMMLEKHFSVPVYICNDVHAAARGESQFGTGISDANFLFIAYGTGIGGAIIQNRKIVYGENGFAGEFGHMITHANGRKCNCGGSGCYEMYGSTRALIQAAMKIDVMYNTGEKIIEAYRENHEQIRTVVNDWLDDITAGLVTLIHIFNPSTLVLGGGIMENDFLISDIQKRLYGQILPAFSHIYVKKAVLGNEAGMYGAANMAIKGA